MSGGGGEAVWSIKHEVMEEGWEEGKNASKLEKREDKGVGMEERELM